MRRGLFLAACVVAASAGWWGCRAPTQVTLTIAIQSPLVCPSIKGVAISVGHDPADAESKIASPVATTTSCDPTTGTVGTIVVTPGDTSTAAIVVVAALQGDVTKCKENGYAHCIVVRRVISFITHTRLELPAVLQAECESIPCSVDSTCSSGRCVSSTYDCNDDGSCKPADPRVLEDGGLDPDASYPDDSSISDAQTDAPIDAPVDAPPIDASSDAERPIPEKCSRTYGCYPGAEGAGMACNPDQYCCYGTLVTACMTATDCSDPANSPALLGCCTSSQDCLGAVCCFHDLGRGAGSYTTCQQTCNGPNEYEVCQDPAALKTCAPGSGKTCKGWDGTKLYVCQ